MLRRYWNLRLARKIKEFPGRLLFYDDDRLTFETLVETHEEWDYEDVVDNPNFEFSWIQRFPEKDWAWQSLHLVNGFRLDWIRMFPDKPWSWSEFRNCPVEFINEFKHKDWNWNELSKRVLINDVLKFPNLNWNWSIVTIYSPITVDEIIEHDHLPWDIENLSFDRFDETYSRYIDHFKHRFDDNAWNDFSGIVNWTFYKKTKDEFPWRTERITFKERINEDDFVGIILEKGFTNWNWIYLSKWADVSVIIKYNMYPWVEDNIVYNKTLQYKHLKHFFTVGSKPRAPCESMEDVVLKWHSACVIQRAWRMCCVNPEYAVCKRHIEEFIKSMNQAVESLKFLE